MGKAVVIVIPSQGESINAFEDSAKKLKKTVYPDATIVRTTVVDSKGTLSVSFATLDGHPFSFNSTHDLARVVTISHAFAGDGPNLAYHAGGYQPWGTDSTGKDLTAAGKAFWQSVGKAMGPDGKVILLGCFMGAGAYAGDVAVATGKKVYASTDLFAAGDADTAVKYVKAIERSHVPTPMKEF